MEKILLKKTLPIFFLTKENLKPLWLQIGDGLNKYGIFMPWKYMLTNKNDGKNFTED